MKQQITRTSRILIPIIVATVILVSGVIAVLLSGVLKKDKNTVVAADEIRETMQVKPCNSDDEAKQSGYNLETWFTTEEGYVVYQYYLGSVEMVPLHTSVTTEHMYYDGRVKTEVELTTITTTIDSIKDTVRELIATCVVDEWSQTGNASLSIGMEGKGPASFSKMITETFGFETNVGYSHTKGGSVSDATETEKSYEKSSTNQKEYQQTVTFKFDSSCEAGYYRFISLGNFDIFANLILDMTNKEYCVKTFAYLDSITKCLEYSKTSKFISDNKDIELILSEVDLSKLEIPEEYAEFEPTESEPTEPEVQLPDPYTYTNNSKRKITEDGKWGLAENDYDTLNLSKFADFMTDDYVFTFKINCFMEELYDGYQEIYIYNQYVKLDNTDLTHNDVVSKYGYVAGNSGIETAGTSKGSQAHEFTFGNISGSKMKTTMYIRYDAWGGGYDSWNLSNLKVVVSVAKKSA